MGLVAVVALVAFLVVVAAALSLSLSPVFLVVAVVWPLFHQSQNDGNMYGIPTQSVVKTWFPVGSAIKQARDS